MSRARKLSISTHNASVRAAVLLAAYLPMAMWAEGDAMDTHKSHMPLVRAIEEYVLVPGHSHDGLWLGPGILFKPGNPPTEFHLFFSVTDRKGGDSLQRGIHFQAPTPSFSRQGMATWYRTWERDGYPEAIEPRTDDAGYRFVPSFNWRFHELSGKALGIGHLLRHRGDRLSNHLEHLAITYSVFDPLERTFSPWTSFRITVGGTALPCVAYGQRVDLPNGDILLPFSTIKELKGWNSIRWCGTARCRFDGETLSVAEVGNLITHPVPRGFVEPSMTEFDGRFFMTLRAQDGHAHVATSTDGVNWHEPTPWRWDSGEAIDMDQTMTKFIRHADGLFLVYTRITQDNHNVFRHRAPLFMAEIDPDTARLRRSSESTVMANRGFPLGNFSVHQVSPRETWVTAQEWDRTGKTVDCDNRLTRIVWQPPNR